MTYFDIDYDNQIVGLRGTSGSLDQSDLRAVSHSESDAGAGEALLGSGLPINSPINPALVTYIQDGRRQNLGGTIAKGIDFDIRNSWTFSIGEFSAGVSGTYFTELTTAAGPGAPEVDVSTRSTFRSVSGPRRHRLAAGCARCVAFVNYVE